jgi:glucose-6-phosphate dehydrogenase assembly protein OpcA
VDKPENHVLAVKITLGEPNMFLNWKRSASWQANFVSEAMFPKMGKRGNL